MEAELPAISPGTIAAMDANQAVDLLGRLDEMYRAPLSLFYLEDIPYKEIADILGIPLGTVQSRIARGKAHLYRLLSEEATPNEKTENE
jgi:RNA polymerase sigma-70 factor (ECF subfamily)